MDWLANLSGAEAGRPEAPPSTVPPASRTEMPPPLFLSVFSRSSRSTSLAVSTVSTSASTGPPFPLSPRADYSIPVAAVQGFNRISPMVVEPPCDDWRMIGK